MKKTTVYKGLVIWIVRWSLWTHFKANLSHVTYFALQPEPILTHFSSSSHIISIILN